MASQPRPTHDREPLTRERVLQAAVRLADESGIEAVSMRRLGQELGVEAMSLYNHVARKDDLQAGMIELVLAEVEPPGDGGNWKDEIRRTAVSSYQAFVRHRWACGLMMRGPSVSAVRMQWTEAVLRTLRTGGFSADLTHHAYHAIDSHITGFTLWVVSMPFETHEELVDLAEAFLPRISPEEFPYLIEHAQQHLLPPGPRREARVRVRAGPDPRRPRATAGRRAGVAASAADGGGRIAHEALEQGANGRGSRDESHAVVGPVDELEVLRRRARRVEETLRVCREVVRRALVPAGRDEERRDREARRERPGVHATRDHGRRRECRDPRDRRSDRGAGDDCGDPPERCAGEHDVPRSERPCSLDRGRVVGREPAVVDTPLREAVPAEVEGEDPDASCGEPPRLREPLAEAAVRLMRQHDGRSGAGPEAAEAVADEPNPVAGREPHLVAANAVVARPLAVGERRWCRDRDRGDEEEERGPHRLP